MSSNEYHTRSTMPGWLHLVSPQPRDFKSVFTGFCCYPFHEQFCPLAALDRLASEPDPVNGLIREGLAEGRFSGRTADPAETTQAPGRDPQATGRAWPRAELGPCGGAMGSEHEAAVSFAPCSSVPSTSLPTPKFRRP